MTRPTRRAHRHYLPPETWPTYHAHEHEWHQACTLTGHCVDLCPCGQREHDDPPPFTPNPNLITNVRWRG